MRFSSEMAKVYRSVAPGTFSFRWWNNMKHLTAFGAILLLTPLLHAVSVLKEARKEGPEGTYSEASVTYESLVKDAKTRHAATTGLSQACASQGEYDKAQAVVETVLKDQSKDADLLARSRKSLLRADSMKRKKRQGGSRGE